MFYHWSVLEEPGRASDISILDECDRPLESTFWDGPDMASEISFLDIEG